MKNENSTENNFKIILSAIFIALSFITLRWLYTGNQGRHFWPLLFMGLITAIFSISIDTYFQARRFKTNAITKN